jgi:pyruvate,water dikinase
VARAHFLELGRRLAEVGALQTHQDVFFLTWDELSHLATQLDEHTDVEPLTDLICRRQRKHRLQKDFAAPPFLPVGNKPAWWLSHVMPLPEAGGTAGDMDIKGVAVSPGVVTGTARVIPDIGEIHRLQPGDILVTEATPPAWTPFFARIAGLVTNRGGKLTHSSIVAREFCIPVVMGTVNATRLIADGQRITVDGSNGTVSIAPY